MDRMARHDPAFKEIELYLLASSSLTPEELINTINQLLTDNWLKEDIMSTAEMLIARGKAEGKLSEKLAIAKRLKELGMPLAQLCQATGLSEEEGASL